MTTYFFGTQPPSAGHSLWVVSDDGTREVTYDASAIPWGWAIDDRLTPVCTGAQSAGSIHYKDGWTALACHDYSVDSRGGSNACFVFDTELSWADAVAAARATFPDEFARVTAEVDLYSAEDCSGDHDRFGSPPVTCDPVPAALRKAKKKPKRRTS